MKDITCTGFGFRLDIINLIRCYRPLRLIETGTYIGSGSTYIIARALRRFKLPLAVFYSIEVNPGYCEKATLFLNDKGLLDYVQIINGLSINRENLSTIEDLQKEFLDESWPENVFVDLKVSDRARLYYRETDFDVPDDKLMECLRKFDFKPDFVFLDSGGHTGREEFRIISEKLKDALENPSSPVNPDSHGKSASPLSKIIFKAAANLSIPDNSEVLEWLPIWVTKNSAPN